MVLSSPWEEIFPYKLLCSLYDHLYFCMIIVDRKRSLVRMGKYSTANWCFRWDLTHIKVMISPNQTIMPRKPSIKPTVPTTSKVGTGAGGLPLPDDPTTSQTARPRGDEGAANTKSPLQGQNLYAQLTDAESSLSSTPYKKDDECGDKPTLQHHTLEEI